MSEHGANLPRVLHIAQSTAGGIASYFEEIASYQSEVYGSANVSFVLPKEAEHVPRIDPAQLITFGTASRTPAALLEFTRTALGAIDRFQPDIVHIHSTFAGALIRARLALKKERPLLVYCPHGWSFAMEISAAKQAGYAAVERILAKVTDLIHVNSQTEFDLAARYGIPTAKMLVIPNGIACAPPREIIAHSGPLRIGFVGRHDRQKGVDILLSTIQRFPLDHLQFSIIGDGILSPRSQPAQPMTNVEFPGWLPREETLALMSRFDAIVMPSRWDAAPIVAIEAMRAGIPVIGSNRGAIPEIVNDGIGGLIFDLDDRDSLGHLLVSLDRDKLKELGKSARKRWEDRYSADRMNVLTKEAYATLLGKRADFRKTVLGNAKVEAFYASRTGG